MWWQRHKNEIIIAFSCVGILFLFIIMYVVCKRKRVRQDNQRVIVVHHPQQIQQIPVVYNNNQPSSLTYQRREEYNPQPSYNPNYQ